MLNMGYITLHITDVIHLILLINALITVKVYVINKVVIIKVFISIVVVSIELIRKAFQKSCILVIRNR
jgi:hypothetical protein